MNEWFKGIDGDGRFWLSLWAGAFATAVVGMICLCVYSTVTEVYNPNPNKWQRPDATPTIRAKLVAEGGAG